MGKLVRGIMAAVPLVLLHAFLAVECSAQETQDSTPRRWARVTHNEFGSVRWWRDGVVTEPDGNRVAWLRIEHKLKRQHGSHMGVEYNQEEHRFRFDCAGRRMQHLETRELLDDVFIFEHRSGPDAEWRSPYMFGGAAEAVFRRVC